VFHFGRICSRDSTFGQESSQFLAKDFIIPSDNDFARISVFSGYWFFTRRIDFTMQWNLFEYFTQLRAAERDYYHLVFSLGCIIVSKKLLSSTALRDIQVSLFTTTWPLLLLKYSNFCLFWLVSREYNHNFSRSYFDSSLNLLTWRNGKKEENGLSMDALEYHPLHRGNRFGKRLLKWSVSRLELSSCLKP